MSRIMISVAVSQILDGHTLHWDRSMSLAGTARAMLAMDARMRITDFILEI